MCNTEFYNLTLHICSLKLTVEPARRTKGKTRNPFVTLTDTLMLRVIGIKHEITSWKKMYLNTEVHSEPHLLGRRAVEMEKFGDLGFRNIHVTPAFSLLGTSGPYTLTVLCFQSIWDFSFHVHYYCVFLNV